MDLKNGNEIINFKLYVMKLVFYKIDSRVDIFKVRFFYVLDNLLKMKGSL